MVGNEKERGILHCWVQTIPSQESPPPPPPPPRVRFTLPEVKDYVVELSVTVVVTDDLVTCKPAVEQLGLEHQVCITHVRQNVANRLAEIDGWGWRKARIWQLLTELPKGGGELLRMEPQVREEPKLRRPVVDLCQKWRSLTCYQRVRGMPQTNNCTERGIGRSKIRYKTIRGYKSREGMMHGLWLTQ